MESTVALQWAYPLKRQSAYATVQADGDLTQSHPFEGADFGEHTPNMVDNAALFGKGHEFATQLYLLSWDTRFRRTAFLTSKIAGWAFAFHTGKVTTTGPVLTAYTHVYEYQDHTGSGYYGSGRQLPVFTVVEKATSGLIRQFPSMLIGSVELTGNLNDFCRIAMDLVGSGKMTRLGSFTFPTGSIAEEGVRLRNTSMTFEVGEESSLQDVSCDIRSWRFRSEYALAEEDGYCPGSGYLVDGDPASGQIRNRLEFLRRAVMLEWVVRASSSNTIFTQLEGLVDLSAQILLEGDEITPGVPHSVAINVPRLKYRAIPIGSDGDIVTYSVTTVVMYDDTLANPFELTVVNTDTGYLVSS
ncbi:MAG TPA: hypothetical protein VFP01_11275 [Propionibacteriaceae bacterium]|nr:hypothetical protein [Propionibacteriaceae bacterium]